MAQVGNNQNRIGGRFLIQENDHMGEVIQRQEAEKARRQADQSPSKIQQQGARRADFNYENPRQVH